MKDNTIITVNGKHYVYVKSLACFKIYEERIINTKTCFLWAILDTKISNTYIEYIRRTKFPDLLLGSDIIFDIEWTIN